MLKVNAPAVIWKKQYGNLVKNKESRNFAATNIFELLHHGNSCDSSK